MRTHIPQFLWLYGAMFALYLVAIVRVSQSGAPPPFRLPLILLIGVLCRATFLTGEPTLSDDVYRYVWDGRVFAAGINPYQYPPDHPALIKLRTEEFSNINHKELETIYPPLFQLASLGAVLVSPTVRSVKTVAVLFDLGTAVLLCLMLRARGRPPSASLLYAWNPLVLVEYAHSGHLDSLPVFLLVLGLWLLSDRRKLLGAASLACSALAKYFSVFLLPYVLWRREYRAPAAVFLVIVGVGYAAFLGAGDTLFSSLRLYAATWEFNSGSFAVLTVLTGHTPVIRPLLLVALLVFSVYHGYLQDDPLRYGYLIIGFGLLFTPTVYPWYVCWIIPFVCLTPNRGWLAFSGLVPLSYWVWVDVSHGLPWTVRPAILWAEYAPLYGLLAWESVRATAAEGPPRPGPKV
ncbi:MAG: hypothetical protein HY207_02900 [Nitrospirae bacterium]|nr:hypothetical protein [Nitrospirota bacterium]